MAGGLGGIDWPQIFRGSLEEQYTPLRARVGSVVLLLMGIAGLIAIICYRGEPAEFFPT